MTLHILRCAAFERICADGGANRIFDLFEAPPVNGTAPRPVQPPCNPSIIIGDLDSLSTGVRAHYEGLGVPCVDLSVDQDSTDLDKCLAYVERRQAELHALRSGGPDDQRDLVVVVGVAQSVALH